MDRPLEVRCERDGAGWRCHVTIGDDAAATHHVVTLDTATLAALAAPTGDPEELVRASFEFLLSNEPRESILPAFDLPLIGRYFPGWEDEVRRRLSR